MWQSKELVGSCMGSPAACEHGRALPVPRLSPTGLQPQQRAAGDSTHPHHVQHPPPASWEGVYLRISIGLSKEKQHQKVDNMDILGDGKYASYISKKHFITLREGVAPWVHSVTVCQTAPETPNSFCCSSKGFADFTVPGCPCKFPISAWASHKGLGPAASRLPLSCGKLSPQTGVTSRSGSTHLANTNLVSLKKSGRKSNLKDSTNFSRNRTSQRQDWLPAVSGATQRIM